MQEKVEEEIKILEELEIWCLEYKELKENFVKVIGIVCFMGV